MPFTKVHNISVSVMYCMLLLFNYNCITVYKIIGTIAFQTRRLPFFCLGTETKILITMKVALVNNYCIIMCNYWTCV